MDTLHVGEADLWRQPPPGLGIDRALARAQDGTPSDLEDPPVRRGAPNTVRPLNGYVGGRASEARTDNVYDLQANRRALRDHEHVGPGEVALGLRSSL